MVDSMARASRTAAPIQFTAALADGRTCLGFDREGEARLTLIVSQQEAAELARRLTELMDTSFTVTCEPE
jgi:hypothetical protein